MTAIGAATSHVNMRQPDFDFPFYISGTVTSADEGKPVTLDTSANYTVKLAGDGDPIYGRLLKYEARSVEGVPMVTVARKGTYQFTYKTGETLAPGDTVVGAGNGEVKKQAVTLDTSGGGTPAVLLAMHGRPNVVLSVKTTGRKVDVELG